MRTTRTLLEDLPNVDMVFYDNPEYVVSETGIGGNTDNANTIFIPLDAKFDYSERDLLFVIRHEPHHIVRKNTLGDTVHFLRKLFPRGFPTSLKLNLRQDIVLLLTVKIFLIKRLLKV